jgi:hypothetical protein
MHIPLGGGPPPHRHDFEESFTLLKGEIEATFRGEKSLVRAGETINIPANAPHSFSNASKQRCGCCASACRPGRKSSSRKWVPRWRPAHQHRQAKKGRTGRVHEEGQRAYSQISHGALKPVRLGTTRLNDWDRLCRTEFLKLSDTHPGIIKGCRVPGTARLNDRNRSPRLGFKAGRIEKTGRIQLPGNRPPQTPVKQRRLISLTGGNQKNVLANTSRVFVAPRNRPCELSSKYGALHALRDAGRDDLWYCVGRENQETTFHLKPLTKSNHRSGILGRGPSRFKSAKHFRRIKIHT